MYWNWPSYFMAKKVLAHIGQHRVIEQIAAESNHVGLLAVPPPEIHPPPPPLLLPSLTHISLFKYELAVPLSLSLTHS